MLTSSLYDHYTPKRTAPYLYDAVRFFLTICHTVAVAATSALASVLAAVIVIICSLISGLEAGIKPINASCFESRIKSRLKSKALVPSGACAAAIDPRPSTSGTVSVPCVCTVPTVPIISTTISITTHMMILLQRKVCTISYGNVWNMCRQV